MECFSFERTWITCGSYALIHAAELPETCLLELENMAGATFGLACQGAKYGYTRVLTPMWDFNAGIDLAAPLWGLELQRFDTASPDEMMDFLSRYPGSRFVLGPISMVGLWYLPMCSQYKGADHFIMVQNLDDSRYLVVDSEGVPGIVVNSDQLKSLLQIRDIPEAQGMLTSRRVVSKGPFVTTEDRLRFTWAQAGNHLCDAQRLGQGYHGVLECARIVRTAPPACWSASLQYSLGDLIQRKRMFQMLANNTNLLPGISVNPELPELLERQIDATGQAYGMILRKDCCGCALQLELLAEEEKMLADKWKDWLWDDWN